MKKVICLFLIVAIFFLYGCAFPLGKSASSGIEKSSKSNAQEKDSEVAKNQVLKPTENQNFETTAKTRIILYYQDSEGYIVPVTRSIAKQVGIARAAIEELIDNASNREAIENYGIFPVLPNGTQVKGLSLKDGIATIDFNSLLLNYKDKTAEKNICSSIVYTLTEFKTIENVKILIDGREQGSLRYNTDISGLLNRFNVLINTQNLNIKPGTKKVDVYFFKHFGEKNTFLIPVSLECQNINDEYIPGKIIEALSKGSSNIVLNSELPPNSFLVGSNINGHVLTLNFNSEIRNYGGNAREDSILKQVLFSMKQLPGIEKVKILINGKEGELPEGTDISRELVIPIDINVLG